MQTNSLVDLLTRYLQEIISEKNGASVEKYRINRFLRDDIAILILKQLTPSRLAAYRDKRSKEVSSAAVRRELTILSHCFEKARKERGHAIQQNPLAKAPKLHTYNLKITTQNKTKFILVPQTSNNAHDANQAISRACINMTFEDNDWKISGFEITDVFKN